MIKRAENFRGGGSQIRGGGVEIPWDPLNLTTGYFYLVSLSSFWQELFVVLFDNLPLHEWLALLAVVWSRDASRTKSSLGLHLEHFKTFSSNYYLIVSRSS